MESNPFIIMNRSQYARWNEVEVDEYAGGQELNINCTQLDDYMYL